MKKNIRDIVISLTLGVIANFISGWIGGSTSFIPASIVFLLSVLLLTVLPEGIVTKLTRRLTDAVYSRVPDFSRAPHAFAKVFNFNGEDVRLVYTCRSRIDQAPCPQHDGSDRPRLKHAVCQHTPVDEFLTMHLMLQWYRNQIQEVEHEGLIQRFMCTYPLDIFEKQSTKDEAWNRANLPDFLFDNLVIIGENSCSNMMLARLKHVLNFGPRFSTTEHFATAFETGIPVLPKIKVDLTFMPNNRNTIDKDEKFRLLTSFYKDSANAVAMICYAPNPFNVQKNVLILYGCHRLGQYLLEDWLYGSKSRGVFRKLIKSSIIRTPASGQIVLYGSYESPSGEGFKFPATLVSMNRAQNIPFFPFDVSSKRIKNHGFSRDARVIQQMPMVDISLIIELSKHNPQLTTDIDSFFQEKLPFLHGHYWESRVQDIGLHVTLYEFATHESHETLAEGIEQFIKLESAIARQLAALGSRRLSLVGCEVFPSSIVLYADLPVSFLDAVRETCQNLLPGCGYLNRLRIPFPLHCTVIRFSKELNVEEQQQLKALADLHHHKRVFGEFQVQTLSLLLTRKQPYQDIERRFVLKLQPESET